MVTGYRRLATGPALVSRIQCMVEQVAAVTITEFLLARIAEDEAIARAAYPSPLGQWSWRSVPNLTSAETRHIAQHDPARVLAECEAKRRIVERCGWVGPIGLGDPVVAERAEAAVLRALASVYADHPDYRDEWRP